VVSGAPEPVANVAPGPSELAAGRELVARLVAAGQNRSTAAKEVARQTGLPRRDLFHGPGESA